MQLRNAVIAGAVSASSLLGLSASASAAPTVQPQNVSTEHCLSHWYRNLVLHWDFCATVHTAPNNGLDVLYIMVKFDFQDAWAGDARAQPLIEKNRTWVLQKAWNSPHITVPSNFPVSESITFGADGRGASYPAGSVLDVYPMADTGFKQPLGQTVFTLSK